MPVQQAHQTKALDMIEHFTTTGATTCPLVFHLPIWLIPLIAPLLAFIESFTC